MSFFFFSQIALFGIRLVIIHYEAHFTQLHSKAVREVHQERDSDMSGGGCVGFLLQSEAFS